MRDSGLNRNEYGLFVPGKANNQLNDISPLTQPTEAELSQPQFPYLYHPIKCCTNYTLTITSNPEHLEEEEQ